MFRVNEQAVVYIVDEDPAVYESLRKLDAPVRWFRNGEPLLQWFEAAGEASGGVIVVEARLGDSDGVELIERLRRRGSRLPVIVICRDADVATAVRAMQSGAADFFARPLLAGVLLRRARALMSSL